MRKAEAVTVHMLSIYDIEGRLEELTKLGESLLESGKGLEMMMEEESDEVENAPIRNANGFARIYHGEEPPKHMALSVSNEFGLMLIDFMIKNLKKSKRNLNSKVVQIMGPKK